MVKPRRRAARPRAAHLPPEAAAPGGPVRPVSDRRPARASQEQDEGAGAMLRRYARRGSSLHRLLRPPVPLVHNPAEPALDPDDGPALLVGAAGSGGRRGFIGLDSVRGDGRPRAGEPRASAVRRLVDWRHRMRCRARTCARRVGCGARDAPGPALRRSASRGGPVQPPVSRHTPPTIVAGRSTGCANCWPSSTSSRAACGPARRRRCSRSPSTM